MRARLLVAAGTAAFALAGSVLAASPALAATCSHNTGDTCSASNVVTVTIASGGISISTGGAGVTLTGGALGGGAYTATMPTTTVTDNRGTFEGWSVSALTGGDLVNSGATHQISLGTANTGGPLTIASSALGAVAGSGILPTTVPTPGSGSLNPIQPVSLFTMPAAGSALLGLTGGGAYTYTPSLSLTVPAGTAADTYSTTVTQTVV